MKKRLIAVALAAASALLLTSCGAGEASTPKGDEKVELTFANWQWLEPNRGDEMWKAMLEYEKVNPNVTLKRQELTRDNYEKSIQTEMGAGGGPDILVVPPALLPTLASASLLVPVKGVSEAGDRHVDQETVDGQRLVYTWSTATFGFFWNKKILAAAGVQPPTTMDEVLAAAQTITKTTGKPGFAVRSSTAEMQPWFSDFSTWIYGYGGAWSKKGKLTIDDPKNVQAVAMLKRFYDAGVMPVGDDASTFRSRFANGEIGMMFDNSAVLFTIVNGNENVTDSDIGASMLPFPTKNSSQVNNFIGVNSNSKHPDAAMGFLRWLSSKAGQKVAAAALFPGMVATTAPLPDELIDQHPWISAYEKQAKHATGSPVIAGFALETPTIEPIVMKAVESVLISGENPKAAMEGAQKQAEAEVG